jgi:hypothetical protein
MGVPLCNVKVSKNIKDNCFHLPVGYSFANGQIEIMKYAVYSSCTAAGRSELKKMAEDAVSAAAGLIQMTYGFSNVSMDAKIKSARMDQFPVPFLCSRNILSPLCEIKFKNLPVYFLEDNLMHHLCDKSSIAVNSGVSSRGAYDCVILACFIESMGYDVKESFNKLITNRMSSRLLNQLILDSYESSKEDIDSFMMMAYAFSDIRGLGINRDSSMSFKQASFTAPSFWIFGLIEKMLAPVRGVRDNIAQKWAPISNEIWERIDIRRKEMGLPYAPMEVMLRVQSEPFSSESDSETLQSRLEEARLWKIKK